MRTSGSTPLAAAYADPMAEVMVVNDDDTVASVVVSYLQRAGHSTHRVGDGAAAITVAALRSAGPSGALRHGTGLGRLATTREAMEGRKFRRPRSEGSDGPQWQRNS